jgi:uncharacterized protein (DUF1800 family)
MPLYGCATPEGYKNTEAAWLSPDAMTRRIAFATQVARVSGGQGLAALLATVGPLATPATRGAAEEARQQPELALALVLGGPGMMRR